MHNSKCILGMGLTSSQCDNESKRYDGSDEEQSQQAGETFHNVMMHGGNPFLS